MTVDTPSIRPALWKQIGAWSVSMASFAYAAVAVTNWQEPWAIPAALFFFANAIDFASTACGSHLRQQRDRVLKALHTANDSTAFWRMETTNYSNKVRDHISKLEMENAALKASNDSLETYARAMVGLGQHFAARPEYKEVGEAIERVSEGGLFCGDFAARQIRKEKESA